MKKEKSIYEEYGYRDRQDYFKNLAIEYGVPVDAVESLADLLGEDEDFDGLVSELGDLYTFC